MLGYYGVLRMIELPWLVRQQVLDRMNRPNRTLVARTPDGVHVSISGARPGVEPIRTNVYKKRGKCGNIKFKPS